MRTRVVIQSRLTSSRLPGKALLTLAGMPLIELVARRAANTGHEVVVATSDEQYDRRIAEHLEGVGLAVVRGPLDDVLGRFVTAAAGLSDTDRVVRLTGDNPVADGALVDELVAAVERSPHDYGRVDIDRVPEGFGAEVFSAGVLREAADRARSAYDREHVTPWIRRSGGELLFVPDGAPTDLYAYRCTVDCLDDYDRVCGAFAGVEDPVGAPWRDLVARVGDRVFARGPVLPRRRGVAPLLLGSRRLPADGAALRDLFTVAVSHGISHTLLHDEAAQRAHRAGTDPALRQRLAAAVRVAVPTDAEPAELLDLRVERMLSHLGGRVDTVLLDAGNDRRRLSEALSRLADLRTSGQVGRLGVVVTDGAAVEELPSDVGWVHVARAGSGGDVTGTVREVTARLSGRELVVSHEGEAGSEPTGGALVVDAASSDELLQAVREVSGRTVAAR
jgi:spore coat polysaccharide biosynthesis protein SpsF